MRCYLSYSVPRSLLAISNTQAEVLKWNGRETVGDYSTFASRAASLFMNSSLFALDEYGVPPETTKRLKYAGNGPTTLSEAVDLLFLAAQDPDSDLDPFERSIRSEEHTSELQSLMRISYAVFCLKKKK